MFTTSALGDVRVLDISTGIAGPLCAKILGDFGADVIKVESPEGDITRHRPPFSEDDPSLEKSLLFLLLNLNKRGITLDIEKNEGADILGKLVMTADLIVENFKPGYLESRGLDFTILHSINPGLIMTSITPFGQFGPYSGYKGEEIVSYGMGGVMAISGTADREPLKHGGEQSQYEAGFNGAMSSAFSLFVRDLTGEGQHIDISIQEVVNSTMVINQPYYSWTGAVQGRRSPKGTMFGNVMPCEDGFFISQPGGGATWDSLAEFYERAELKCDQFANPEQRVQHGAALDEIIVESTKHRSMEELFKTASEKHRMLFGIVQTAEDLANCPQLEARDFYQKVNHPSIGSLQVPFKLFNMTETEPKYRMPAPLLGQHNEEIYSEILECPEDSISKLKKRHVI